MVTLHSFLAILAGFATLFAPVLLITALLEKLAPGWASREATLRPTYVLVNLLLSAGAAIAGGYVTARITDVNPLSNVLALGIVVLVLGALSVLQGRGQQPLWYQIALLVLTTAGVFLGGLLRLKLLGLF